MADAEPLTLATNSVHRCLRILKMLLSVNSNPFRPAEALQVSRVSTAVMIRVVNAEGMQFEIKMDVSEAVCLADLVNAITRISE